MQNSCFNAKKAKIGDIFEIHVSGGYAYGQAIFYHKTPPRYGWFVRVFVGINKKPERDVEKICQYATQFVSFFLLDHYVKAKEVLIIGNTSIPLEYQSLPPLFKKFFMPNKSWYLSRIDGGQFSNGADSELIGKILPECYRNLPYGNVLYYDQLVNRIEIDWTSLDDPPSSDFVLQKELQNEQKTIKNNSPHKDTSRSIVIKLSSDSLTPNPLKKSLCSLLDKLDAIADSHEEIYDTVVRESMNNAIWEGFVLQKKDFCLWKTFCISSRSCNKKIKAALQEFLDEASEIVSKHPVLGVENYKIRLLAFQDSKIESKQKSTYDDFFGHREM